jgi:tRNA pseudouridine55 synthase
MINLYKYKGETPLQALERLRRTYPEYEKETLSYAGRLDPMAEGVLLVMEGDENKKRAEYLKLEKEYIVDVLWGIETDTYDILGKIKKVKLVKEINNKDIWNYLEKYICTFEQTYPPYSSQPVMGRPLFEWSRSGKNPPLPTHTVTIHNIGILKTHSLSTDDILLYVKESIEKVKGDFRQQEILERWKDIVSENRDQEFWITRIQVRCSSGVYMRMLAHDVGKDLQIGALAYAIIRTKVGKYGLDKALK